MERKLFIIRHGKSSWEYEGLDDIDRPLAERGIRNSDDMARRLLDMGTVPDLLLTSPASRALNTALIMSRIWALEASAVQIHDALYDAFEAEIFEVIASVPGDIRNIAVFGHNPTFTMFANRFLPDRLDNLPTAGVVIITLESDGWKEIGPGQVKETYVDFPKRFPGNTDARV